MAHMPQVTNWTNAVSDYHFLNPSISPGMKPKAAATGSPVASIVEESL